MVMPNIAPISQNVLPRTTEGGYFRETRRPIYALLLTLPFLAVYEIGILVTGGGQINGGDWIIRMLFSNRASMHGATVSIIVMAIIFLVYSARHGESWKWNRNTLLVSLAESLVWALVLVFLAGLVNRVIFNVSMPAPMSVTSGGSKPVGNIIVESKSWFRKLALYCGAGVFEELVFRVLLLLGLAWFISFSDRVSKKRAMITAAILSAFIFSAFHYRFFTGSGDAFRSLPIFISSFIFRVLAGLYFTALCYGRNFGIAVATHGLYDIIIGM